MINNVVLVGRLGNEPELTHTNSGTALCKFRIACERPPKRTEDGGKGEKQTDWLNVTCWGKVAENVAQYLDKGSLVAIEARAQSSTWTKEDGTKGYGVEFNASRVQFLESKKDREERHGNRDDDAAGPVAVDEGTETFEDDDEDPFSED